MDLFNTLKNKFFDFFYENSETKIENGLIENKICLLIKNNNLKTLKEHLEKTETDIDNIFSLTKYSALSYAIVLNRPEIVKLLISYNANVNFKDKFMVTPLMQASALGYLDIIEVLLDNKAEVDDKDFEGVNAKGYAEFYENVEVIEFLENYK